MLHPPSPERPLQQLGGLCIRRHPDDFEELCVCRQSRKRSAMAARDSERKRTLCGTKTLKETPSEREDFAAVLARVTPANRFLANLGRSLKNWTSNCRNVGCRRQRESYTQSRTSDELSLSLSLHAENRIKCTRKQ